MKMTNAQYKEYVEEKAPKSAAVTGFFKAWLAGGLICCLGEALSRIYTVYGGMSTKDAGTVTSVTLVFLGALLTGLGVYDNLAKFGGAGTLVPITGFANAVAAPALEFKSEGFVMGTSAKIFSIAGPVIVFGVSASIIYGVILQFFT